MNTPDKKHQEAPIPTASREIWRWDTSGGEVAVVELQDYDGGRRVVSIRRWYRDRADKLRPGRTGISFPLTDLDNIENAVEALRMIVPRPPAPEEDQIEEHDENVVMAISTVPPPKRFSFPRLPIRRPDIITAPRNVPTPPPPSHVQTKPEIEASVAPKPTADPDTPQRESTLAAIFAMGLVAAPLALRLEVGRTVLSGVAYANGSIVFGNRRFANPREAVSVLRDQKHVVDGWHALRYRNPKTQRFAKLSRLRGLYQAMCESPQT